MAGEGHLLEVNHEMCESHSLPFKMLGAQVSWVDSEPRLSLLHPGRRGVGGWVGGGSGLGRRKPGDKSSWFPKRQSCAGKCERSLCQQS